MKRISAILIIVVFATTIANSQQFEINSEIDSFGISIKSNLAKIHNAKSITTGKHMEALWPELGSDEKTKIINHVKAMVDKGYKIMPSFISYFEMIDLAKNKENVSAQQFSQLLDVTGQVMENNTAKELALFEKFVTTFFKNHALYFSNANQLLTTDPSYSFEYHGGTSNLIIDYEEDTTGYEDDLYEDEEDEYGDEFEDEYDDEFDEYDDEYDDYDEYNEDEFEEKLGWEEPEESYFPEPPLALQGPVIVFSDVSLQIVSKRQKAEIKTTKGAFLIFSQKFSGEGGTVDWSTGGLGENARVVLPTYNFDVRKPYFIAKVSTLEYPDKLHEPIEGEFEYDGKKGISGTSFISYKKDIKLKNTGIPGLSVTGGFSLVGNRIFTKAKQRSKSVLQLADQGIMKFKSVSESFTLVDSVFWGNNASITVYHGFDSIYHPSSHVRYNIAENELVSRSTDSDFRYTPYYSSYINMEITADLLHWSVDSDSLEFSIISGKAELPALIQSVEYFNPDVLASLGENYGFNPVLMVANFVAKKHIREFYPSEIADNYDLETKEVTRALQDLAHLGYLNYDQISRLYSIRKKTVHYSMAKKNKVDYDNFILLSKVSSGPNMIFDIHNNEMHVNGIDRFYISDILDVYIEPANSQLTLGSDREFVYDGKLFAGNFEYAGRGFKFNYDSFKIDMQLIDEIQLYIQDADSQSSQKTKISNVISGISETDSAVVAAMNSFTGSSGKLLVNVPNNKSGKKIYPSYPKFEGGGNGFVVYFSGKEYLDGAYAKSLFMIVPPFSLDSLSDSDPAAINFSGKFNSSGIMPEFSALLHIMPDLSLGFDHSIPPEGYPLFEGDAFIYNKLSLDNEGLRSHGEMKYLTSDLYANDFIFYPDSIVADGATFEMRQEEFDGVTFPQISVNNYRMKWLTTLDSMHIDNNQEPFQLYDGILSLDGRATLTHRGVFGSGNLQTQGSEAFSKEYNFKDDGFTAKHAEFKIISSDPEKPALAGNDVSIDFNLVARTAEIKPEVKGEAALEFPFAQFKTSISTAVWDLDSATVTMSKPENVDIESSYFYTTREDLDSLSFNATQAVYNMNTYELKVSGIPYITVADADITPENGEVLILENSRIGTLYNTTIVLDTLNAYHQLFDGTIDIVSRNEFSGSASYEYINAVQDTFAIKLGNFRLEKIPGKGNRATPEFQTVANGMVPENDHLLVSPGMLYKGDIIMEARKPTLELDGYIKLDLNKIPNYDTWIQYTSDAEQQEVILDFDNGQTEFGDKLIAGLHFDYNDYSLYSTFINAKHEVGDDDFFVPSGKIRYNPDSSEYIIITENKDLGLSYEGAMMIYYEDSSSMHFEGPVHFIENTKDVKVEAVAIGDGKTETNAYNFDALVTIDFNVNTSIFDFLSRGLRNAIDLLGAPEAIQDRTSILYKLADFIGDRAAKDYEKRSFEEYTPLASMSSKLVKPIVFSELKMKWSDDQKSFYNEDGILGISNVLRSDINASFEGFFEIRKDIGGDRIDIFIKAAPEIWYYFSYADNKLLIYSSDSELNDLVKQKTNQGKAKITDLVFAPGDIGETQSFVNTFRMIYYGIKEPYELGGAILIDAEEKKKVTDDDDDEGF